MVAVNVARSSLIAVRMGSVVVQIVVLVLRSSRSSRSSGRSSNYGVVHQNIGATLAQATNL